MAILPAWVANQNTEFALSSLATESAIIYILHVIKSVLPKSEIKNIYISGGYSRFQVMGMIEWGQKSKPKKIPRASKETPKKSLDQNLSLQKSLAEFPRHKNFLKTLNYIIWKEKHKFWIPKKILAKIFLLQKILRSSLSLKIQIIPPPLPGITVTMTVEPWMNLELITAIVITI